MPINPDSRPSYIYKDGTWYTIAGKVATGANYVWGGTHTFNSSLTANGAVEVKTKFNCYDTASARNLAITSPQEGLLSYIENDSLGLPVNRFEYWDGTNWIPLIPLDIVLEDSEQTLTNKTLDNPDILGGINNAEYIQFDMDNAQAIAVGKLMWDEVAGTLVVGIGDGTVSLNLGSDLVQSVVNEESLTTIPRGNIVYQSSSATASDLLTVRRARADSPTTSKRILGVTVESISSSQIGLVMRRGLINNVDTSAFPQGSTIYLSAANIGGFTHIRPVAPSVAVKIGYCVESSVNGIIYIDIQEGFELDELTNVKVTSKTASNIIQWNGSFWFNTSSPTGLTIDGSSNTLQNISQSSVTGLSDTLSSKLDKSLIDGGQTNQILVKSSGSDFDFRWSSGTEYGLYGIPTGGLTGQILVKKSNADFDFEWQTVGDLLGVAGGPGGSGDEIIPSAWWPTQGDTIGTFTDPYSLREYRYHKFYYNSGKTWPNSPKSITFTTGFVGTLLMVAGGGGIGGYTGSGQWRYGAGGGGCYLGPYAFGAGTHNLVVGRGGYDGYGGSLFNGEPHPNSGQNTYFDDVIVFGGGVGGNSFGSSAYDGGSGGGSDVNDATPGLGLKGSGAPEEYLYGSNATPGPVNGANYGGKAGLFVDMDGTGSVEYGNNNGAGFGGGHPPNNGYNAGGAGQNGIIIIKYRTA